MAPPSEGAFEVARRDLLGFSATAVSKGASSESRGRCIVESVEKRVEMLDVLDVLQTIYRRIGRSDPVSPLSWIFLQNLGLGVPRIAAQGEKAHARNLVPTSSVSHGKIKTKSEVCLDKAILRLQES